METSVVITTYNSPRFLSWVLESILWQTKLPVEILVADDGSDVRTTDVIGSYRKASPVPIVHSYQPDRGFRLARSRNLAALKSSGRWIIFLDGDCVLPPNFIERQAWLARRGRLLFCSRKLISKTETEALMYTEPSLNAVIPLLTGRKFFRLYAGILRRFPKRTWASARGFLLCLEKNDFVNVGGFDENYQSWGLEDSDFVLRAQRSGVTLTDARYMLTVLHLFHGEPSGGEKSKNLEQFIKVVSDNGTVFPQQSFFLLQ